DEISVGNSKITPYYQQYSKPDNQNPTQHKSATQSRQTDSVKSFAVRYLNGSKWFLPNTVHFGRKMNSRSTVVRDFQPNHIQYFFICHITGLQISFLTCFRKITVRYQIGHGNILYAIQHLGYSGVTVDTTDAASDVWQFSKPSFIAEQKEIYGSEVTCLACTGDRLSRKHGSDGHQGRTREFAKCQISVHAISTYHYLYLTKNIRCCKDYLQIFFKHTTKVWSDAQNFRWWEASVQLVTDTRRVHDLLVIVGYPASGIIHASARRQSDSTFPCGAAFKREYFSSRQLTVPVNEKIVTLYKVVQSKDSFAVIHYCDNPKQSAPTYWIDDIFPNTEEVFYRSCLFKKKLLEKRTGWQKMTLHPFSMIQMESVQMIIIVIIIKDSNISVDTDASLPYNHKLQPLYDKYTVPTADDDDDDDDGKRWSPLD
ncbi:hypothetical protein CLF_101627, partial [Clonorchis sinensis]